MNTLDTLKLARQALQESHPEAYRHVIACLDQAIANEALNAMAENAKNLRLDYEPAQQHGCSRSHPHENMDAMCELRTEIARLTNENARLKLQRGVS